MHHTAGAWAGQGLEGLGEGAAGSKLPQTRATGHRLPQTGLQMQQVGARAGAGLRRGLAVAGKVRPRSRLPQPQLLMKLCPVPRMRMADLQPAILQPAVPLQVPLQVL